MADRNLRNAIEAAAADAAVTLTYQGNDRVAIDTLATAAAVSVDYQGSDDNYLALVVAAIEA